MHGRCTSVTLAVELIALRLDLHTAADFPTPHTSLCNFQYADENVDDYVYNYNYKINLF